MRTLKYNKSNYVLLTLNILNILSQNCLELNRKRLGLYNPHCVKSDFFVIDDEF